MLYSTFTYLNVSTLEVTFYFQEGDIQKNKGRSLVTLSTSQQNLETISAKCGTVYETILEALEQLVGQPSIRQEPGGKIKFIADQTEVVLKYSGHRLRMTVNGPERLARLIIFTLCQTTHIPVYTGRLKTDLPIAELVPS